MEKGSADPIHYVTHDTIDQLMKLYRSQLRSYVRKMFGTKVDAEDAAQQAFEVLWERAHKFNDQSQIEGFLCTTAKNYCINTLKAAKKYVYPGAFAEDALRDDNTEIIINKIEWLHRLEPYLQQIPPANREVIRFTLEGLSIEEISILLKKTKDNISGLKSKGTKMLRTLLAEQNTSLAVTDFLIWLLLYMSGLSLLSIFNILLPKLF